MGNKPRPKVKTAKFRKLHADLQGLGYVDCYESSHRVVMTKNVLDEPLFASLRFDGEMRFLWEDEWKAEQDQANGNQ